MQRTPRPCGHPGCTELTSTGKCAAHQQEAQPWYHGGKSASARGYGYRWRKLRESILDRDGHQCQECKRQGLGSVATCVDHIKPKSRGGTDDPSNLESLCDPCHEQKSKKER